MRLIEHRDEAFAKMVKRITGRGGSGRGGSYAMRMVPTGFYAGDAAMPYTMSDLGVIRMLDGRGRLQRLEMVEGDSEEGDDSDG
jgi:hypothetical protein